jgi:hypothetical protein
MATISDPYLSKGVEKKKGKGKQGSIYRWL